LWGCEEGRKKILGKLEKLNICLPKENRGLGIKNIFLFNEVVLTKWR